MTMPLKCVTCIRTAPAVASNRICGEFASVAAHELREPLRMVEKYAELLHRDTEGKLNVESVKSLGFVRDGAKRLSALLDDLLSFTRITRLPSRPIQRFQRPFQAFTHIESASGIVLLVCTAIALVAANSPYAGAYQAFWDQVTAAREVVRAFAYAIDRGDRKQVRFQQILESIGFEVKLKPFIQRGDGSAKGDWDVGITLDMIDLATEVDVAVLVSGDGDFAPAIRASRTAASAGSSPRSTKPPGMTHLPPASISVCAAAPFRSAPRAAMRRKEARSRRHYIMLVAASPHARDLGSRG